MNKKSLKIFAALNKIHEQEAKFKKELAKTFLEYLDALPTNKRIEQIESVLYETYRNLPTHDRRLTPQEIKCLFLASKGKEIKEMASILGLSQRTIKYHRANITKKLEVPNLMAAVASWIQCNPNHFAEQQDKILQLECNVDDLPSDIYWKRCIGKKFIYSGMNHTGISSLMKMGFKWKINDILGKTDEILFGKETADIFLKNDREVIYTRAELTKEEIAILPCGERIIQLSTKRPLFDTTGKVIGIVGISRDITKIKEVLF